MNLEMESQRDELQALAHERLGQVAELEARVRDLMAAVAQAQATTRNYRKRAQRARRQRDELRAQLEQRGSATSFRGEEARPTEWPICTKHPNPVHAGAHFGNEDYADPSVVARYVSRIGDATCACCDPENGFPCLAPSEGG